MTHKVFIFPKLRTAKGVLRSTAKRPPFTRPFEKWHGKWSQTPLKSAWQHLHQIYWSLWIKLSWKESLLVIQKIFGLLVNTLSTDKKYSFFNRGKATQPIQMQISKKQKKFPIYFFVFFVVSLSLKKLLLVIQKMVGLLINTLTTDDKYSEEKVQGAS